MANNLTKIGFWLAFAPLLALYIALAMPMFGYIAFEHLAHYSLAACGRSAEGFIEDPCIINVIDARKIQGFYLLGLIVLGLANPLIAFFSIQVIVPWYILIIWICTIVLLWILRRSSKREA